MEETLLKISGVSKHFGGVYAVNGVDLHIKGGGIWGLVGPNGSGKSTLFSLILGHNHPDDGLVHFQEHCISNLAPHEVYGKGLVNAFQVPRPFQKLSVLDNMLVAARGHGGDNLLTSLFLTRNWQKQEGELADKAMEILRLVELDRLALAPAGELSGGQRKLLEIARGLMADPTLLLLDEPAAGVNPKLGRKIFEKIEALWQQKGLSFLIIEHRLDLLFDFAHWVYVMDKGKIVIEGKPADIAKDPAFYRVYIGDGEGDVA
jgi:branched-chain amino acid transport system ATP-binding protein